MSTQALTNARRAEGTKPTARRHTLKPADQLLPTWLNSVIRTVFALVILVPVAYLVVFAFSPEPDVEAGNVFPSRLTVDNFVNAFTSVDLARGFLNSLVICASAALITVVVASAAAYPLARYTFPASGSIFYGSLGLQLVPGPMLLLPMFLIYSWIQTFLGISVIGSYWGLVITYVGFSLPLSLWLMVGYVRTIPRELDEAAWVDGASRFATFWRVVAPLTVPGMIVAFILALLQAWNDVMFASVLTSDQTRTLAVDLQLFTLAQAQGSAPQYAPLMASGVFMAVPVVAIYLVLQRYLVGGLAAGAIK